MLGVYYLHENGDLIWKPESAFLNTTVKEYMDSPFVLQYWVIPNESPTGDAEKDVMWTMNWLFEAYNMSQNKSKTEIRVREICKKNGFPEIIAERVIREGKP